MYPACRRRDRTRLAKIEPNSARNRPETVGLMLKTMEFILKMMGFHADPWRSGASCTPKQPKSVGRTVEKQSKKVRKQSNNSRTSVGRRWIIAPVCPKQSKISRKTVEKQSESSLKSVGESHRCAQLASSWSVRTYSETCIYTCHTMFHGCFWVKFYVWYNCLIDGFCIQNDFKMMGFALIK